MEQPVIGVTAVGMDERSECTLALALKQRSDGQCALTAESRASIAVIDLDNPDALEHFRSFRARQPTMPTVALAKCPPENLNVVYLTKPVPAALLITTIRELASTGQETVMDNKVTPDKIERALKAIDAKKAAKALGDRIEETRERASPLQRSVAVKEAQTHFDPSRFLLGQIQTAFVQAGERGQAAVLTCWEDKTIVLEPGTSVVSTNLSDGQIRSLAIVPCDSDTTRPITVQYRDILATGTRPDTGHRLYAAEVFLWNLGLLTSRGRVPTGISLNERVYLRRWPNLTRMVMPPSAMRVLAYWIRQPCELLSMFDVLEVPLDEILSIYTAAHAANLAGPAKRRADFLMEPTVTEPSQKRGILSAVLRRLLKQSQSDRQIA